MNQTEKYILSNFKSMLCDEVNPVQIFQTLCKMKMFDNSKKGHVLVSLRGSRINAWDSLFPLLESSCEFQSFLQALLNSGYVDLCLRIAVQFKMLMAVSGEVQDMQRVCLTGKSRKLSQNLFIELKIKTHNLNLEDNPRKALHNSTQRYKLEYINEENKEEKMIKADQYAASLCAEIDSHTMLYRRELPKHGLFPELEKLITETTNSPVTKVAYDSRLAIASVIAGQDDLGEDYLRNAFSASVHIGQCVELVNMLYIYVFNLLCRYEKKPCRRIFEKILDIAELALTCLQDEDDDIIRNFWSRMLYLRMTYALLGISNKGDIIPRCSVLPKHVKMARELLTEVDKIWKGIEARRQMFYYVAQARLSELECDTCSNNLEVACEYINMAVDLGSNENFGEINFIKTYAEKLIFAKSRQTAQNFHNKKQAIEHEEETKQEQTHENQMYNERDIQIQGSIRPNYQEVGCNEDGLYITKEKKESAAFSYVTDNSIEKNDVSFQSLLIPDSISKDDLGCMTSDVSVICLKRPCLF